MSVALPLAPAPRESTPSYLDFGGTLKPIFGGAMQKLLRLGDRFALNVTLPPLSLFGGNDLARVWIARLVTAQRSGALLPWPQPGFDPGAPGAPLVDGANQAGSSLSLRGFSNGYTVREGQFFSIIHGGRRYVEMATATMSASAAGALVLPISPMLRIRPADGAICEFARPFIEGFLDGDTRSWTIDTALTVGLTFQITEVK